MIGSAHRFHGHNSLRTVYQRGQTARRPQCLLRYLASDRRTGYRAAVVVSRKVHKSAVKRNRIRRRIYAVITEQQVHFQAPYDLVFTVLDETLADMPALKLHELIGGLLEKAGVTDPAKSSSTHATIVKKESKEA